MALSKPLCIIPARGNSKRIPRKNLVLLGGIPLLLHTINAAKESGVFSDVYVSSEDAEILELAGSSGCIPLQRPPELSGDAVNIPEVCLQVLAEIGPEKVGDAFGMLQATSPLRTAEDVRAAYAVFTTGKADAVVSVCACVHPPQRTLRIADGFLTLAFPSGDLATRAQDLETLYMPNGAVNFIKTAAFLEEKTFFAHTTAPYVMPEERAIDIDEPLQMAWAEFLLGRAESVH